ncbi:hypothetical protein RRG08_055762 [Elysia crispata]|uniref:Uncharacterized protein n=1 Tax=Elysia crispata TaxID=231223 RepID=A0AAE1AAY1_9GAST|nr:hypothetical protein RRG08_055762 [Elysia crispata]
MRRGTRRVQAAVHGAYKLRYKQAVQAATTNGLYGTRFSTSFTRIRTIKAITSVLDPERSSESRSKDSFIASRVKDMGSGSVYLSIYLFTSLQASFLI